ncbi:nectin-1-like [Gouania willdenowi]|uniref:nectin-1-like n=1 Tax=Gouania willdenowi TaxID=441366 RepID=UPI001055E94B|nr:nectin-1-like [Gouania willdenowi]
MENLNLLQEIMMIMTYFLSALEAQKIQVVPEVTEYVGSDVTLLCQFTLTPEKANVTQVQWDLTQPGGAKFVIVVIHDVFENAFHESPLKDRVDVSKHSLIIKDVTKEDSGLYTCTFSTFPLGSFKGNTNLVVREPISSGIISAIVVAVVVLLLILIATTYLIFVRRCNSAARQQVIIDAAGPAADVVLPSVTGEPDVVYTNVKYRTSGGTTQKNPINRASADADNVTYSVILIK